MRALLLALLASVQLACGAAQRPIGAAGSKVASHYKYRAFRLVDRSLATASLQKSTSNASPSPGHQTGDAVATRSASDATPADAAPTSLSKQSTEVADAPTADASDASGMVDARDAAAAAAGAPTASPDKAKATADAKGNKSERDAQPARTNARYPLRWPVDGSITSRFGGRSGRAHDGIDISAPMGTKVFAAADGEVLFSEKHGGYGNLVVVKHVNGLVTVYAHHQTNLVKKGEKVSAGQAIARVGQTGRASAPHLHFEVRQGVRPQNPLNFLPP